MATVMAILKIVLLAALGSAVLGAISGLIYSAIIPDHAHQIIPTWMFMGVIGAVLGLVISLICSFIFRDSLDANFIKAVGIAATGSEILMIALLLFISTRK